MKRNKTKTTSELFRWLCETPERWRSAGLKEFDRKYYLRLWKRSRLPDQVTMERQLKKAGYKLVSIRRTDPYGLIEATWSVTNVTEKK